MTKTKTFISTWTASYPYELRKIVQFNFDTAEEDVYYEIWEHYTGFRKKLKWRQLGYHTEVGKIPYRGDEAWAKRLAKRFNLDMPK